MCAHDFDLRLFPGGNVWFFNQESTCPDRSPAGEKGPSESVERSAGATGGGGVAMATGTGASKGEKPLYLPASCRPG